MSQSLFPGDPLKIPFFSSSGSRPQRRFSIPFRFLGVSSLLNLNRLLVIRSTTTPDDHLPDQGDKKDQIINKSSPSSQSFSLISNFPTWAQWVLGSIVIVALSYYQTIYMVKDRVEKRAEQVLKTVEKIAEDTDKLCLEVAEKTEDRKLKQIIFKVKEAAEVVDNTAETAESLIKKVDGVVEEVNEAVKKLEEMSIRGRFLDERTKSQTGKMKKKVSARK